MTSKATKPIPTPILPLTQVEVITGEPFNGKPCTIAIGLPRLQQSPHLDVKNDQEVILRGDRRQAIGKVFNKIRDSETGCIVFTLEKTKIEEYSKPTHLDMRFDIKPDGTQEFKEQHITIGERLQDAETDGVDIESDLQ